MKKLMTSVLVLTMAMSLAACGIVRPAPILPNGSSQPTSTPTAQTESVPETTAPEVIVPADTIPEETIPATTAPQETPTEAPEKDEPVPEDTKPQQKPIENVQIDPSNYFRNDSNNAPVAGQLAVQPRYVRWENGKLVADCFVINGTDKLIYNINIKALKFSNDDGVIATGGFGVLEGLSLAPNSYVTWTFSFSGDAVKAYGAQLGHLITDSSWGYSS